MLKQIESRYDPENDTRSNGPPVTWAERDLYDAVISLGNRVEALERMRANIIDALDRNNPDEDLALKIWSAIS